MNIAELKSIFEKDYNRADWTNALHDIFHIQDLHITPQTVALGENNFDASALELGFFETAEGLLIGLYEVAVSSDIRLDRNKVGLRNLMRKVYTKDVDAALIVFSQGATWRFTYASELTVVNSGTGKRERRQTDPKRYTYIFGQNQLCRTAAERFGSIKTITDLFDTRVSIKEIEKAFSVEALTKDFYKELSDWYFWALQHVQFPDDAEKDEEIRNSSNTIRLITRLIFVWFLKQKGLIPEILFEKGKIFSILKHGSPSTYYKAILQNLFFATLNQEMGKRKFRKESQHYNITNLFRYEKLFKNPLEAIDLFQNIPFLNGGLFECLDKPHPTEKTPHGSEKIIRIDGFSDRADNSITCPDYLFFGGADDVDLSVIYGDNRQRNIKIRGIIDILNSYNFTVEENTPLDIQVALDPELLGNVFENLLASYNPETKTTARKQTGSFYTPREIVSYMVDESLIAYLKNKLSSESGGVAINDLNEVKLRELVSYSGNGNPFSETETKILVQAIDEIRVLDPACGSGAFPMGVLQQLVHMLQKLDPDNVQWKHLQLQHAQVDIVAAVNSPNIDTFSTRVKEIADTFDKNAQDYGRKLFLIENCLYGVDIQPIAVQIAKLRFFISLLCEQNIENFAENLGIRALPNLETKFVAANTLLGLESNNTFKPDIVYFLEKKIEEVRHRHFGAPTPETKRKCRELDTQLRRQIAAELINSGFPATSADQIAAWNPYDQNTHAPFFDKYWMFGIEAGFDIVIGNPPYVDSETMTRDNPEYRELLKTIYNCAVGNWDLFVVFVEKAMNLCRSNGFLSFIVPNKLISAKYTYTLREFLNTKTIIELIDYSSVDVFKEADVYPVILISQNRRNSSGNVNTKVMDSLVEIRTHNHIESDLFYSDIFWDKYFFDKEILNLVIKITTNDKLISHYPQIIGAATVGEAYQIKNIIKELGDETNYFKFINTGTIDRYQSLWGVKRTQYIKQGYDYPILRVNDLQSLSHSRYQQSTSSKIIIAGMAIIIEAFFDTGEFCAGKSTSIILGESEGLKTLTGILNSTLVSFWFSKYFNSLSMAGGYFNIGNNEIGLIPIPAIAFPNIRLNKIVNRLIDIKNENPQAETTSLERSIDEIVYKLYALSYEEVLIVDPEFWLSEEDYANVIIE